MNTHAGKVSAESGPWYKERWTWLLMTMPVLAIIGGGITMWLAITSFDGLVADDYYKQGMGVNKVLARAAAARDLGLKGRVLFSMEEVTVELTARPGVQLPKDIMLTLAHPTRGGADQVITMNGAGGVYRARIPNALVSAHWKVLLEDESHVWRLSGAAFLPTETEIRIDAADVKPID